MGISTGDKLGTPAAAMRRTIQRLNAWRGKRTDPYSETQRAGKRRRCQMSRRADQIAGRLLFFIDFSIERTSIQIAQALSVTTRRQLASRQ